MKKIIKNIREVINKYDNIFVIILIAISILGITLDILITNSDELWNFQSIYKMYNGYKIYKDFNVIITPLFFIIGEFLFKAFGANFLTFRIYNLIIMTAIYFIIYLLLKQLKIKKKVSLIIVLLLMILENYIIIKSQANYNTMALMIYLIGVYLYIKKYKYNNIIQGIILFLLFSTKQNVCVYYGIGLFVYEILKNNQIKEKIKNLIVEFITFIILLIGLIVALYLNNNLNEFINYTILGIKEFASKNIFMNASIIIFTLSIILINLIFSILFIKNRKIQLKVQEKENLILLNCFAIPVTLMIIPIMNETHLLLGIYLSIILLIYIGNLIIKNINLKINIKFINITLFTLSIMLIVNSTYHFVHWIQNEENLKEEYEINKNHPFYGGIFENNKIKSIQSVIKYVEDSPNKVIVLSNKAALYIVPLKQNNGDFDLPFKGNLGKDGEEGLVEKIKNTQNVKILIEKNEDDIIWQESKLVRKYIMENMTQIGEIEEFYIYQ